MAGSIDRMSVFSNLVVGLDGSPTAEHALRWAADRVVAPANIHVVHSGGATPNVPADIVVSTVQSRDGSPGDALVAVAAEIQADAIVIGPHGSGAGLGVGSVAKSVLRAASIPVLVVDGLEPPRSAVVKPPVVACVGYGDPAQAAATWAAHYASDHELPLVLLHAVAYRPVFPLDSGTDAFASYFGEAVSASWAMDELKKIGAELRQEHPDLVITAHVDNRSVLKAVRAAGELAELVALGKRSDEEFLHAIGTPRLRRLVARTSFPTAVVPAQYLAR